MDTERGRIYLSPDGIAYELSLLLRKTPLVEVLNHIDIKRVDIWPLDGNETMGLTALDDGYELELDTNLTPEGLARGIAEGMALATLLSYRQNREHADIATHERAVEIADDLVAQSPEKFDELVVALRRSGKLELAV